MSADPAAECLRALSVILDLANGLAEDKSVLTAGLATRIAEEVGADEADRRSVWYAALLRHLGCTAFASVEATLATDDIALRSRLLVGDSTRPGDVVGAVMAANDGPLARVRAMGRLARGAARLRSEWTRSACEAAHLLSDQLGLGPAVARALDEVFERFDGTGGPRGLGGSDLSRVGRIAHVAHTAVVHWLAGGPERAGAVLRGDRGRVLDPALAMRAADLLPELDRPVPLDPPAPPDPIALDAVAVAFGDFADLQVPGKYGHSRAVATLADRAATALGLSDPDRRELRWAAHLHDLGEVGVPSALWLVPRAFRPAERERIRLHPYLTERVLAGAAPLASVARIAGSHHERLDGSGYHRGADGAAISRSARILAVADAWSGMSEPRPHRPSLTRAAATEVLRTPLWDPDCVDAVLGAAGEPTPPRSPTSLTSREVEVLRHLARGQTNKEIAHALGISARTVQHHTLHIYEKLGVSTRAGAGLVAARSGLLA